MKGADFVFHLAANADVRFGTEHPERDLDQNTIATFNVLEAMRANGCKRIGFSSTGSIYGEPEIFPTPEDAPFPLQTSLYGASKLAAEGMIQAYCEGFGFQGYIFRFVSILGERYTHGHVFDFYKKLSDDPTRLHVLGDGKQRKSYLYVHDCIDAMLLAIRVAEQQGPCAQSRHRRSKPRERLDRLDFGAARAAPGADLCGRRARMDRRQPVHPAGHATHSRARLEAEAHHPRGCAADRRLACAKSLGVRAAPHEARGLRPVASRHGDRRLHGCGRDPHGCDRSRSGADRATSGGRAAALRAGPCRTDPVRSRLWHSRLQRPTLLPSRTRTSSGSATTRPSTRRIAPMSTPCFGRQKRCFRT